MGAALGAIIGAAAGQAGGDMSSGIASAAQYQASKHERNIAWKRAQQWELIGPSLKMAGLQAAGLNPILAATGGFKGGAMSEPSMGSPGGTPSFSRDAGSRLISAAKQGEMMSSQVAEQKARQLMAEREADAARYLPERAYHAAGAEGERWSQLRESVALLREQQASTAAQTARTRVGTALDEAQLPSAKALEELYEKYPWLRQVGAALKDVRR